MEGGERERLVSLFRTLTVGLGLLACHASASKRDHRTFHTAAGSTSQTPPWLRKAPAPTSSRTSGSPVSLSHRKGLLVCISYLEGRSKGARHIAACARVFHGINGTPRDKQQTYRQTRNSEQVCAECCEVCRWVVEGDEPGMRRERERERVRVWVGVWGTMHMRT